MIKQKYFETRLLFHVLVLFFSSFTNNSITKFKEKENLENFQSALNFIIIIMYDYIPRPLLSLFKSLLIKFILSYE